MIWWWRICNAFASEADVFDCHYEVGGGGDISTWRPSRGFIYKLSLSEQRFLLYRQSGARDDLMYRFDSNNAANGKLQK